MSFNIIFVLTIRVIGLKLKKKLEFDTFTAKSWLDILNLCSNSSKVLTMSRMTHLSPEEILTFCRRLLSVFGTLADFIAQITP